MADEAPPSAGTPLAGVVSDGTKDGTPIDQLVAAALSTTDSKEAAELLHLTQQRGAAIIADNQPRTSAGDAGASLLALEAIVSVMPGAAALAPLVRQLAAAIPRGMAQSSTARPEQNHAIIGDPVDPATGQLNYSHVDLQLNGGGIVFEFARTYRSGARYPAGPLGVAWDHSLALYLRELSPDVVVASSGQFREDRYVRTTPTASAAEYYVPSDGFHSTIERVTDPTSSSSFVLTRPDGMRYEYAADSASDPALKPDLHRIARIADRFGNQLLFEYDSATARLSRVIVNDPASRNPPEAAIETRFVWFDYDDLGRITAVHDSTGRVVHYTYDDYDDLISVTLPATPDYTFGRTMFYEYSSEAGPVAHQLLSIVDEDGRRYLDVEYGVQEGFMDYARVVRQRDDEGEWLFEYAVLEHPDPPDRDTATRHTIMARPSGHRVEMEFNAAGNLLTRWETTFDEDGALHTAITRFKYNADGELLAKLSLGRQPEAATPPWSESGIEHGILTQQRFSREDFEAPGTGTTPTAEQRRAFGNRLKVVRRASPAWPPPDILLLQPDDILQELTYQNPYQLLTTKTDPRDSSVVTTYHYDPISTQGSLIAIPAAVTRIEYPATTAPDGSAASAAIEQLSYDALGRLTRTIDTEGHQVKHEYFGATDFAPADDDPSRSVTIDGFLKSISIGVGELDLTTTFVVNARGAAVKVTDPRGGVTSSTLDARDLPTRVERVLQRAGANDVVYASTSHYIFDGRIKRQEREVKDDAGTPLGDGLQVHFFRYGDTGQLLRESVGGPDPRTWLATRHVYDDERRRTRTITPLGNTTHVRYDAQGRPIATTHGFGTPDAATTRTRYDLDGRTRALVDPLGHVTRYDYDRFGRVEHIVQVVDVADQTADSRPMAAREGHTRVFTRDAIDNVTLERFFEWTAPGQYRLLSRMSTVYDERARVSRIVRDLFDAPAPATSLDDFRSAPPAGSIAIEAWLFRDGSGHVVEQRDGIVVGGAAVSSGSSTLFAYDAAGRNVSAAVRLLEFGGAVVTQTTTSYDGNGNPVRVDRIDNELDATGAVVAQEAISSAAEYDSLNRKVADIDGLGNRTTYRFDSRDLPLERRDPLGNSVLYEYDRYGRRITRTEHLDPSTAVVARYDYDADDRAIGLHRQDSGGRLWSTAYEYDAVHRRVATVLAPDSSFARRYEHRYDTASNIVEQTRPNGLIDRRSYDALNRLQRVDYDFSAADPAQPIGGTPFEQFAYDGLGRVIQADTDATSVVLQVDSLGRVRTEQQSLGGSSATVTRDLDSLGNRTTLVYPSGRTVRATYDSANRLATIDEVVASAVGAPSAVPRTILARTSIGSSARRDVFANGFVTAYARDAAGRRIMFDHADGARSSRLQLVSLFDAVGNRAQDWQVGSEAAVGAAATAYTYDGVSWLTGAGPSSITAPPPLAPPILPSVPVPSGAPPPPLAGQSAVEAALGQPLGLDRSYAYDVGGNRKGEIIQGAPSGYDVDPLDRDSLHVFDLDGNALDPGKLRHFDAHDRLVAAESGFAATYDALGRRVALNEGTTQRRFIYDGVTEIAEYDGFGLSSLLSETVIGTGVDDHVELSKGAHTYVVHRDFVGSTRMLSDESGAVRARFDFDAYGRMMPAPDAVGARHRFMGREWDASLELYHFRARHYDFSIGRFLQRDPAESEAERSAYRAFGGNPLLFVDPMGTDPHRSNRLHFVAGDNSLGRALAFVSPGFAAAVDFINKQPDADREKTAELLYENAVEQTRRVAAGPVAGYADSIFDHASGALGHAVAMFKVNSVPDVLHEYVASQQNLQALQADVAGIVLPLAEGLSAAAAAAGRLETAGASALRASSPAATVYRFASRANPETLLPNLSRAGWFTRLRVNFMMVSKSYRVWRADLHMRGNTVNSPFVSVLRDPAAGAASTDPWLRTIITGRPGMAGVARAPDLGEFAVPPSRLIGPTATNTLSQAETEMVFHGNDLAQFLINWMKNPH